MSVLAALPTPVKLILPIAITLWMVAIAIRDHRTGRIPNSWTAPVIFGAGLIRLLQGFQGHPERFGLLLAWAVIFGLWMLHFMGGGDAKFLMGVLALFPFLDFVALLALVLLVITVPLLVLELRRRRPGDVGRSMRDRLSTGLFLPTEQELQERGRRYAWTFAVPGIIYTLFYWPEFWKGLGP